MVETDDSDKGIGVVMQNQHPITYLSKALSPRNQSLAVHEKECLAILMVVDHCRPYLSHLEFLIRIDHKSLIHLMEQKVHTPIQQRALTKLMGLHCAIQYKQGQFRKIGDTLSRRPPTGDTEPVTIFVNKPVWLEIVQSYFADLHCKKLLEQLVVAPDHTSDYSLANGILQFKGIIWIGNDTEIQKHINATLHDSALEGHSGFYATYHRIKRMFPWKHMKQHIKRFVQQREVYQQAKIEQAWAVVSLDFIEGLLKSGHYDTILVVIDTFTKYACFLPLSHPFTALSVAKFYINNIFKLHGLPQPLSHIEIGSFFFRKLEGWSPTDYLLKEKSYKVTKGKA